MPLHVILQSWSVTVIPERGGSCFKCGGMESLITVCPNKFKCGVSQLLVAVADAGKSSNGKERHLHLNDHL